MIDQSIIPSYTIRLAAFNEAAEVSHFMKSLQIKKYVYEIVSVYGLLKVGKGGDNEWLRNGTFGDRIYRQAAHIPGWANGVAGKKTSGNDFLPTINRFPSLHKNDVSIRVYDMSNYPVLTILNFDKELEEFEDILISEYETRYMHRPIGNPKKTKHAANSSVVSDQVFQHLF